MSKRQRMTWAALDREAAAPPAIPGYGVEDQDHPAHTQGDPGAEDYMIGTTSDFAEDVHPGPYGDSGPPAIPGYGVEDQDHPAHQGQVGRQASINELIRRKSAKALVLARATLGKTASWQAIEDQAFDYVKSMSDDVLNASVERLGGDFLGMEDEFLGMDDDLMDDDLMDDDLMDDGLMGGDLMDDGLMGGDLMDDGLMGGDLMGGDLMGGDLMGGDLMGGDLMGGDLMGDDLMDDGLMGGDLMEARLAAMEQEIAKLGAAGQNAAKPFLAMFDAYDTDGDGFVTAEDWGGPRGVFASLDTDGDGIVARHEVVAGCEKMPEGPLRDNCEKKSKGGDDDKGSDKEAFGQYADFDDDELEMLSSMQVGMDDLEDEGEFAYGDVMASKKAEDDDDEGEDKEASFFQSEFDPMGLSDGSANLTAADDEALRLAFAVEGSEDEDEDEDEDEGGDKEARLNSLLQPQAKKASKGVKQVGSVPRTKKASANSEIAELSSLWAVAPDVSGSFG